MPCFKKKKKHQQKRKHIKPKLLRRLLGCGRGLSMPKVKHWPETHWAVPPTVQFWGVCFFDALHMEDCCGAHQALEEKYLICSSSRGKGWAMLQDRWTDTEWVTHSLLPAAFEEARDKAQTSSQTVPVLQNLISRQYSRWLWVILLSLWTELRHNHFTQIYQNATHILNCQDVLL